MIAGGDLGFGQSRDEGCDAVADVDQLAASLYFVVVRGETQPRLRQGADPLGEYDQFISFIHHFIFYAFINKRGGGRIILRKKSITFVPANIS